ncbi:MAG: peroxide stress protein YaaA [Halobacteriovoraceae bacterium]|jgi:uncharacterized protein|nr:peroxide stress protein YaaA [Halobacteriovoraceae bacterium]
MIVVVSPAKKLDFTNECQAPLQSKPDFLSKTNKLAKELRKLKANDVGKLMKLSANLSELNFERFQNFKNQYNPSTSKQAVFAFNGDTYTGLDIQSFNQTQLKRSQSQLRILSGLYGVLKPMDLIQPYRLEMGTKYKFLDYKNLYEYWQEDVTNTLKLELAKEKVLINCASQEYFNVIDTKKLNAQIITPVFKELKSGELKIISFAAKRARGMMAKYIIQNNITKPEDIQNFSMDRYKFSKKLSDKNQYVFTRS